MDPVTIGLITGLVVSAVTNIVVAFRKNIKRSSCLGGSIEFKSNTPPNQTPTNKDTQITISQV